MSGWNLREYDHCIAGHNLNLRTAGNHLWHAWMMFWVSIAAENEFVVIAKARIVIRNLLQDSKTLKLLRAGQSELIVRPPPVLDWKHLPRWGFANAKIGKQENKGDVIILGTFL